MQLTNLARGLGVLAAACTLPTAAWGTVHVINPTNNIQATVNAAASGDTIQLTPGTYNQTVDIVGKSLTLEGTDPATTIVSAAFLNNTVIRVTNAPAPGLIVRNLTIRDGRATGTAQSPDGYPYDGGGISAAGTFLSIANCRFQNNSAGDDGGAIYSLNSGALITGCVFDQNSAAGGGGAFIIRGDVSASYCTFSGNSAPGSGGAIHVLAGPLVLNSSTFTSNSAPTSHGGAIYLAAATMLSMTDCVLTSNSAALSGGAISSADLAAIGPVNLTRCTFTGNAATASGGDGGAIYAGNNAQPTIEECTFTRNTALDNGGAIYKSGAAGALKVSRTGFLANTGLRGGGIRSNSATAIDNSIFVGNEAGTGGSGGALYNGATSFVVLNATAIGNVGSDPVVGGSAATFKNCLVRGNASNTIVAAHVFTHSNVEQTTGVRTGTGNINGAPLLAVLPNAGPDSDWGTIDDVYGDLSLMKGSVGIDAADSPAMLGYAKDFAGVDRNVDDPTVANTGVPAWALNVDMGAFEYQPTDGCAADFDRSGTLGVSDIFDFLNAWFTGCP